MPIYVLDASPPTGCSGGEDAATLLWRVITEGRSSREGYEDPFARLARLIVDIESGRGPGGGPYVTSKIAPKPKAPPHPPVRTEHYEDLNFIILDPTDFTELSRETARNGRHQIVARARPKDSTLHDAFVERLATEMKTRVAGFVKSGHACSGVFKRTDGVEFVAARRQTGSKSKWHIADSPDISWFKNVWGAHFIYFNVRGGTGALSIVEMNRDVQRAMWRLSAVLGRPPASPPSCSLRNRAASTCVIVRRGHFELIEALEYPDVEMWRRSVFEADSAPAQAHRPPRYPLGLVDSPGCFFCNARPSPLWGPQHVVDDEKAGRTRAVCPKCVVIGQRWRTPIYVADTGISHAEAYSHHPDPYFHQRVHARLLGCRKNSVKFVGYVADAPSGKGRVVLAPTDHAHIPLRFWASPLFREDQPSRFAPLTPADVAELETCPVVRLNTTGPQAANFGYCF